MRLSAVRHVGWLARHWKQITLPAVVFDPKLEFCGQYWTPHARHELIDGQEISRHNGILSLGTEPTPSTIGHEFRHHFQWMKTGWAGRYEPDLLGTPQYWEIPWEKDALLFELALEPDEVALEFADSVKFSKPCGRLEAIDYFLAGV